MAPLFYGVDSMARPSDRQHSDRGGSKDRRGSGGSGRGQTGKGRSDDRRRADRGASGRDGDKGSGKGSDKRSDQRRTEAARGNITSVTSGQLPRWVRDEIVRSTGKEKREPALFHLAKGMEAFADERYRSAIPEFRKAKELSPRAATVRELLGLAAYRSGQWEEALRELRTFRRITGDLTHTPVELDCLRALGRQDGVATTWKMIQDADLRPETQHEARVVYASHLLDEGRPRDAWAVIRPARLVSSPSPAELRRWFVAARVALAAGDREAARKLLDAVESHEVDFEGVEGLRAELA